MFYLSVRVACAIVSYAMCVQVPRELANLDLESPCELPDVGAGDQALVLYKNSKHTTGLSLQMLIYDFKASCVRLCRQGTVGNRNGNLKRD